MLEPKFKMPIKNQQSDHGFRFVVLVRVFKLSLLVLNLFMEKRAIDPRYVRFLANGNFIWPI